MAKPTITEKDLDAGISSLGGFGNLTKAGSSSTRRDSPFGSSYAKPAAATPPTQQTVLAPKKQVEALNKEPVEPQQAPLPPQIMAPVAVHQPIEDTPPLSTTALPAKEPVAQPQSPSEPSIKSTTPRAAKIKPSTNEVELAAVSSSSVKSTVPKTQIFTERVTMVMDSQTRDELNQLALVLQRRKSDSSERITTNTLMRVAIKLFLEELRPQETDSPNSEAELYQLTKARVKRRC
jgi:hypothetical protein